METSKEEQERIQKAEEFCGLISQLREELGKVIAGQARVLEGVLVAFFAGGHVLLEGVPGLGKTVMVKTLAEAVDLKFSRIQFTPDLMPSDIVGTNLILDEEGAGGRGFRFQEGPVFANLVLADEVNRATPKTQSALLEAMQEGRVTVAGKSYEVGKPFFVLATQNPLEMEGTYPLPEAQLDRFLLKLRVDYPTAEDMREILERTTGEQQVKVQKVIKSAEEVEKWKRFVREVPVAREVQEEAIRIVRATHPETEEAVESAKKYVRYGASPRGVQALILAGKIYALLDGRHHVAKEDVHRAVVPALAHRILLNFEGEAEGVTVDQVIEEVLQGK